MIVVGLDGSDGSHRALRFAIDEGRVRGARLRVICAWEFGMETWGEVPTPEEIHDLPRRRAEQVLAEARRIVERLAPTVECECLALEAKPLQGPGGVLLEHSSDASLVVVGREGHGVADRLLGSVADAVLGSASLRVVRDAECPVVVVPHAPSPS